MAKTMPRAGYLAHAPFLLQAGISCVGGPSSYLGRHRAGLCRTPQCLACPLSQTGVYIYLC